MQLLKRLIDILPASYSQLVFIVLLFIFSSATEVIGIGAIGPFISLATSPELIYENKYFEIAYKISGISSETVFVAFVGVTLILVFFLKSFIAWFTQAFIIRFSEEQQRLVINKLISAYLTAPYIYHTQKNSSSIIEVSLAVAGTFSTSILRPILSSISNLFVVFSLFALLIYASPSSMVVVLCTLAPTAFILNGFRDRVQRWGTVKRRSAESIVRTINHAFGGVKETKVVGCEDFFEDKIIEYTQNFKDAGSNFSAFRIVPRFLFEALMLACVVGMMSSVLFLGQDTQTLIPVLGIYGLASIRLIPAISNTIAGAVMLKNSAFTVNQIYAELFELSKLSRSLDNNVETHNESGQSFTFNEEVSLSNISFSYSSSDSCVIDNISLSIKKGESIGFIGKSGSGKTTLVDIVLGLLIPQSGNLLIDGNSIYSNLDAWRKLIGYIPQSIFLMDDSLEKNIAFGVDENQIDYDKIWKAIDLAQLRDVVEGLPNGIKTNVGERGVLLSGGQRQRVGIARSVYHDSDILVLDEATAALDNETEKLVTEAIAKLRGSKTLITIAHRLSTVENCDRIYVMDRGRIVKSGTFAEVVCEQQSV
ncbi:MAG: ABC transporter ATP-binding protein [Cyanobacteria bacterium P01_F01_bin.150]